MMNRLLGRRKLARTSSKPGRTRSVNYFLINDRWYFVDLPGYGYAKASKADREDWARLIDAYLRSWTPGSVLIQLVDGKVGATALDLQAHEYLCDLGIRPLVVATKIDKVSRSKRPRALAEIRQQLGIDADEILAFSAPSNEGTKDVWKAILAGIEPTARPLTTGTT